jgi:hypothetical protein
MFKGNVKKLAQRLALIPAVLAAGMPAAFAALDTATTTAVASAKADINEAGALGIGIFLAIMVFLWLRRVMK